MRGSSNSWKCARILAVGEIGIGLLRRRSTMCLAAHHPDPMPSCQALPKCDCPDLIPVFVDIEDETNRASAHAFAQKAISRQTHRAKLGKWHAFSLSGARA